MVKCVFQGLSIYFMHACFLFIKVCMTYWILISKYLELNKEIYIYIYVQRVNIITHMNKNKEKDKKF